MQSLQATHLFTFGLPTSPISLSLESLVLQYLKQASQSVQRVEEVSPLSSGPTCSSSPDDASALLTEMGDYLTRTAMIWAYLIENLIKGPHIDHVTLQILENSRAKTNVADLTEATSLDITLGRLRTCTITLVATLTTGSIARFAADMANAVIGIYFTCNIAAAAAAATSREAAKTAAAKGAAAEGEAGIASRNKNISSKRITRPRSTGKGDAQKAGAPDAGTEKGNGKKSDAKKDRPKACENINANRGSSSSSTTASTTTNSYSSSPSMPAASSLGGRNSNGCIGISGIRKHT
ncbi:hypothetical protein TASIC1_0004031300 [Trichoderma asperellum]|uniref:Uncharacterized protein n=1 Tax=Trichoderma asperellum TaxID=101201 RepID=A0A6V8QQZ4_TRIAP|nr:hypothetical protein TASIC1_0004031300 [Trichoderma asperellum]